MFDFGTKVNNNPSSAEGVLTAEEFNNYVLELENAVASSGQSLDASGEDVNQLAKAMAAYGVAGGFFLDFGITNTFTLSVVGLRKAPDTYIDGMQIRFFAANTVTGAAVVNLAGLGSKQVRRPDGSQLSSGDIQAGSEVVLTYRDALGYFVLSQNVTVTGNQNVFDLKTFNTAPRALTDPAHANDLVRKSFLDSALTGLSGVPVGTILDWPGGTAPTGFVLAFGQAISRTTYATLFAAIGETYGSGDGSTTFNVPDLRGRTVFGKDNMGGSAVNRINLNGTVLGGVGGAERVTLTIDEMPSHNHSDNGVTYGSGPMANGSGNGRIYTVTGNTGGGQSHNNMPPYMILNKIIKL